MLDYDDVDYISITIITKKYYLSLKNTMETWAWIFHVKSLDFTQELRHISDVIHVGRECVHQCDGVFVFSGDVVLRAR